MQKHQSINIRQISRNWAEQMAYYRFLENENVTLSELVRSIADECQQRVEEKHILAISDSSEINLQSDVGRLSPFGLGVVGNNTDVGFYIHPTLVLDGESGFPLGLSTLKLWSREIDHADKHEPGYKNLPIEEKESYKWLASASESQKCFEAGRAKMVTHIGDRESDLFIEQLFATLKTAGLNLEATQLESVIAIQRLTILALSVAVRTLQMVEGRDNTQLSAALTFGVEQQQCLGVIQSSVEGETQKLQNPYPQGCLPWATWIIARLGGWSGYLSQRPPGMPTLVHGFRPFESIFLGWKLAQGGLVYTR